MMNVGFNSQQNIQNHGLKNKGSQPSFSAGFLASEKVLKKLTTSPEHYRSFKKAFEKTSKRIGGTVEMIETPEGVGLTYKNPVGKIYKAIPSKSSVNFIGDVIKKPHDLTIKAVVGSVASMLSDHGLHSPQENPFKYLEQDILFKEVGINSQRYFL